MTSPFKSVMSALIALAAIGGGFGMGASAVALLPQEAAPRPGALALKVPLAARAAVIYDIKSGAVLYQKNANEELPLASLAKLMAAHAALAAEDPSAVVEITAETLRPEGDSGLRAGEAYELNDLVRLALVASSNDAAAAVALGGGDDYLLRMNAKAQEMGLTHTRFLNPTGLDVDQGTAGAYGSAYDVARLAAAFFKAHPALFEETVRAQVAIPQGQGSLVAAATAAPLLNMPGLIGGKTGYTDLAGGNLVVGFDLEVGRPAIAVVLGSTRDGRFSDMRNLITAARENL